MADLQWTGYAPLTISEAAPLIRSGQLTPIELLERCLARVDRYEDKVRAWAYLDRDRARKDAERSTEDVKQGLYRGPLHGIPIGIKDVIDVFDMPTGCGSKLWANSYARRDASCVARLRQAGAIVMGKTVTCAYASFDPSITRNPWNLERTPGGSSSGSAAAVACGMCLGALGTQTGGSLTRPASYCGVYSLKPTYGRVSVDGVLPLAPSLDHVGVMANCVRDLAILLQPLPTTNTREAAKPYHYLKEIDEEIDSRDDGWTGHNRLATLPDFPASSSPEMTTAFAAFLRQLKDRDWGLKALPLPTSFALVPRYHQSVMAVEAALVHAERQRHHPEDYPPKITRLIEEGLATAAPYFSEVKSDLREYREQLQDFRKEHWNIYATPATTGPAPGAETTGNPAFNSPWSYFGLPTVSLPFHWTDDGLPLAVQLIANGWDEADLLGRAQWLEDEIGFQRRPLPL